MAKRVGFVVNHEADFATALVERLRLEPALDAELVSIGGVTERPLSRWDVIVDGASELVPHYRAWLRAMALAGTAVVNDPFAPAMADRFFAMSVARRAGVRIPHMVLLPQHSYGPGVDHANGLRNLEDPLGWEEFVRYVRFPALLRPIDGGLEEARLVDDLQGLWHAFDGIGERVHALQAHVEPDFLMRGICIGGEDVVLLEGPSGGPHRLLEAEAPSLAVRARAAAQVRRASRALGIELAEVDLAVVGEEIVVIDTGGRIPTLGRSALGATFGRVVDAAAVAIERVARSGRGSLDGYPVGRRLAEA